jgi:hypothetical protein
MLGQLMLYHLHLGRSAASFSWSAYLGERCRLESPRQVAWFVPEDSTCAIAADVVQFGVFREVTARKRITGADTSVVAKRWTAIQLQRVECSTELVLAPFDARVTKEESAVRLALEAQRLGVTWDSLAARCDSSTGKKRNRSSLST